MACFMDISHEFLFFIYILKKILIYIWLCWVFIAVCRLSLAAVHGFHIVVASLFAEHSL